MTKLEQIEQNIELAQFLSPYEPQWSDELETLAGNAFAVLAVVNSMLNNWPAGEPCPVCRTPTKEGVVVHADNCPLAALLEEVHND